MGKESTRNDGEHLLWSRRVDEKEVARLCTALVRKVGREAAVTTHRLFKALDKGEVLVVGDLEPRELRKKVRHLCEAYTLSPVDMVAVPGAKPVVLSFRKPSECPLKLAHSLKEHLTAAVSKDAREEADNEGEAEERAHSREVNDFEMADHARRMELIAAALQAKHDEEEALKAEGSEPAEPVEVHGMLSLEEYRDLKQKGGGRVAVQQYTRTVEDVPQKSLMEMTREGAFGDTRAAADRFNRAVQKQDMWGKSANAQRKRQLEINMRETKRARLGEGEDDSDEGEPWNRFDREKIFQPRQATERDFDNLMQMAAEHRAGFSSGRIE